MASEQLLSVLRISQEEVTLVTGDFFNTRLNIIKVERGDVLGLRKSRIVDQEQVCNSIKKVTESTSNYLGLPIERVILLIPNIAVKRLSKKITIQLKNTERRVDGRDIKNAINELIASQREKDLEVVNVSCNKFILNNKVCDGAPIGAVGDILTIELDLFFASKELTYSYVMACEKAGLKVMEIYLDAFASGKEMVLFDKSVDRTIVAFSLHEDYTSLSLFNEGQLVEVKSIDIGYGSWLWNVVKELKLNEKAARKLCRHNLGVSDCANDLIIWCNVDNLDERITQGQLNSSAEPKIMQWADEIKKVCQSIAERGTVMYYLYGEGTDIAGIKGLLQERLNSQVEVFIPDTIGARTSDLVSLLGCFYSYNDQGYLYSRKVSSLDIDAYNKIVADGYLSAEKVLTKKTKNIFF